MTSRPLASIGDTDDFGMPMQAEEILAAANDLIHNIQWDMVDDWSAWVTKQRRLFFWKLPDRPVRRMLKFLGFRAKFDEKSLKWANALRDQARALHGQHVSLGKAEMNFLFPTI